jgi:non-heme chloroperoxidase
MGSMEATTPAGATRASLPRGKPHHAFVAANDGTPIFYKDWGAGSAVVFSHGWPLSADAWDEQLLFLASHGYRAVAHDRRGHGRSGQPWAGNTMDNYADDLAAVIEGLDLSGVTLVGHSTGGGEVIRYVGRHGTDRVARIVLMGAIPPLLMKTDANPDGAPLATFDQLRAGLATDRSQFYRDLAFPFYGANRAGATVSEGVREAFWRLSMQAGLKASYDCIHEFSESDFHQDLQKVDVPLLLIHGDDDQIVPIGISARKTVELVPNAQLKVYAGAPHGLMVTHRDQLHADLLAFLASADQTGDLRH